MFFKRGVLKNFIKKRLQHRFFPVNIAKKEQFYQKRLQRNSGEYCEILKTAILKKKSAKCCFPLDNIICHHQK